jgi:fucose permease
MSTAGTSPPSPPDAGPASATESRVVNAAGLAQGIVLVTFPAASTILTSPSDYDLSSTQYGTLFLPQAVTAISASLLGSRLAARFSTKRVYLAGLMASLVAMLLLLATVPIAGDPLAYGLLLVATAFLGVGFGLTVPALNTFAADFHPATVDRSVLVLNALLGLGTALAPVFVAIFDGLGFWWGLPVLSAALIVGLVAISAPLPLRARAAAATPSPGTGGIPRRFWLFAGFAVLYGVCETMNGNWAQLDMTGNIGASTAAASLALTAFWAMVTVGRVLFASIQRAFPTHRTYHLLPFVLAGSLTITAVLPSGSTVAAVLSFGLAGLGCSALLPLTISFGEERLVTISAAAAGAIIAFYQLGYGIAAFGTGPLQDAGVSLSALFAATAVIALAMAALSFMVAPRQVKSDPAGAGESGPAGR